MARTVTDRQQQEWLVTVPGSAVRPGGRTAQVPPHAGADADPRRRFRSVAEAEPFLSGEDDVNAKAPSTP